MHIAIDARIIKTSTGRYVEQLLVNLEKIDTKNTYSVLVLAKDKDYWKPSNDNFHVVVADFPNYSLAEQIGFYALLRRLHPDLVHFCMPQQPLLYTGKRVTTVHDLTLVRFENIDGNPLVYKLRKLVFTGLLKNVIRRSAAVITPTEYVRKDVLDFTSMKYAPKVHKTLEGWDAVADNLEPIKALKRKKFVFFVGNAFPYKNINTIIDAFAELYEKEPELHLALAGKKDYFYEQVEKYAREKGVMDRVHILGFISEGEKRWMFHTGVAYIIASFSEGFHIPGLEAMSENCPVLSSNATCLPEVYAEAALYFDPNSATELARLIGVMLHDQKARKTLVSAGKKRLKDFSWQRMAKQTHDIYLQALTKKAR